MIRIAVYAAVFDHPDSGGDIVRRGAFADAVKSGLPVLLQHNAAKRVGLVEDILEDDRGLRIFALLDAGQNASVGDGLSFGYRVRRSINGTYRELLEVDLLEVSLVSHPMQSRARIIAVEDINQGD